MADYAWVIIISLLIYFYEVTCVFFTVKIAALKGRGRGWGWLGLILGVVGFAIVCFLPNKKSVEGETNPIKAAFRKMTDTSPWAVWLMVVGVVVVIGGVLLGNYLTSYFEEQSLEEELSKKESTTEDALVPSAVYGAVENIFTGDGNNFAITKKGDLYGWGDIAMEPLNEEGCLYKKVKKIAVAGDTIFLLTADGTLFGKGDNAKGLIIGTEEKMVKSFKKMEADVADFDLSNTAAALVTKNKNLYIWGTNTYGQLGKDVHMQNAITEKVASSVKKVVVTERSVYYMNEKGEVFGIGSNAYGQFGKGDEKVRNAPVKLASGCIDLAAGEDFTLLLKKDGTIWSAGNDSYGQLGRETLEEHEASKEEASKAGKEKEEEKKEEKDEYKKAGSFAKIKLEEKVDAIYAAGNSAFAMISNRLYAWGRNDLGQLGTGDQLHCDAPTMVYEGAAAVAAGRTTTMLLNEDGALLGAGDRRNYQLGSQGTDVGFEMIATVEEEK